jgi:hypothetical protein
MKSGLRSLGELTFLRSYSKDGKENYGQTVERYLDFWRKRFPGLVNQINGYGEEIQSKHIVPSMRLMQYAGPAIDNAEPRAYNCVFVAPTCFKDFADITYLLCCGCGVGLSVENHYVSKIPSVPDGFSQVIEIPDTKEGWALSFEQLLLNKDVEFIYDLIRPAGAPLSIGGTASGPGPLKEAHDVIRLIIRDKGSLTSVDVADISCLIGRAVVSGSSRRSAEIILSDVYDEGMKNFKSGNWFEDKPWRCKANISSIALRGTEEVAAALDEQLDSPFGERGVVLVNKRDYTGNIGTNPCVTGDTAVLTRDGYKAIKDLVGNRVEVWNGFEWTEVQPECTGHNQEMLKVTFSDGRVLTCTKSHIFHTRQGFAGQGKTIVKPALELAIGDKLVKAGFPVMSDGAEPHFNAYAQGFKSGDGMDGYGYMSVYFTKFMCLQRLGYEGIGTGTKVRVDIADILPKTYIPFDLNLKGKLDWLSGVFDSDGCELKEGGIQLVSVDRSFLKGLQDLLSTVGVQSKVVHAQDAGLRPLPDGKGGSALYQCQASCRICIGATQVQALKALGLSCLRLTLDKSPNRDASVFVKVVSIEPAGVADKVFCFTDHKRHMGVFNGVVTGQCGEISLKNRSFCNLSEVIVSNCPTEEEFFSACRAAAFFGTLQASLTNFTFIHPDFKKNCEEEALIGVSLTGQAQAGVWFTEDNMAIGADIVVRTNQATARKIGINPAKRATTTKPSGSTSCVMETTSGVHGAAFRFGVRRIRITKLSPLGQELISRYGISEGKEVQTEYGKNILPVDKYSFLVPEVYDDKDLVAQFPANYENAIYVKEEGAVALLERCKKVYHTWVTGGHSEGSETNNISLTVAFHPHEKEAIKKWALANQESYRAISTLPHVCGYELLPFEELTKEEYDKYFERFPDIDLSSLGVSSEAATTSACSGSGCEVV